MAALKPRVFPDDRNEIDEGSIVDIMQTDEFYTYGSSHYNTTRPAKKKVILHENCIKIIVECDGEVVNHYVYHEDMFHPSNHQNMDESIAALQRAVLNVWKNDKFNGYITQSGIQTRKKLLKARTSKL